MSCLESAIDHLERAVLVREVLLDARQSRLHMDRGRQERQEEQRELDPVDAPAAHHRSHVSYGKIERAGVRSTGAAFSAAAAAAAVVPCGSGGGGTDTGNPRMISMSSWMCRSVVASSGTRAGLILSACSSDRTICSANSSQNENMVVPP